MKYLLDVNALVACGHATHAFHQDFHTWAAKAGHASLHTCAHTELGFLRVSMHTTKCALHEAEKQLAAIRELLGGYIADCPPPALAPWAATASKTTDAYLCQLAATHGLRLATFDADIKDHAAFLIA